MHISTAPQTNSLHGRAGCCGRQAAASGCRRVWRGQQRGLARRPALAPHPSGSSERLPASMAWAAARLGLERLRRRGVTNVGGRKVFAHRIGSASTNSQRIRRRRSHLTAAATTDVPSRRFLSGNGTRPSPRERMAEAVASRFALESHNKPAMDGIIIVIVHALSNFADLTISLYGEIREVSSLKIQLAQLQSTFNRCVMMKLCTETYLINNDKLNSQSNQGTPSHCTTSPLDAVRVHGHTSRTYLI